MPHLLLNGPHSEALDVQASSSKRLPRQTSLIDLNHLVFVVITKQESAIEAKGFLGF
jgi:hypothetical protein